MMKICNAKYGRMAYMENDTGIGRNVGLYGEWVQLEIDFLMSLIKEGDTVLDVGANIGSHTMAFARAVGDAGKVLAFEPQDRVSELLEMNIGMNNMTNVAVYPYPVGDEENKNVPIPVFSYNEEFNFGGASIKDTFYQNYVDRPLMTIDSLKLEKCDLIKADVEGFELEVLRGSIETIRKYKPFLYLENNRADQLAGIQLLLAPMGYAIFSHTPPTFNPNNFNGIKENPWHGNYLEPNMIALPIEKISMLQKERWIGKRIL